MENERIVSLYLTAKESADALENGDVEAAYFALREIEHVMEMVADQKGVTLPETDEEEVA